MCLYRRLLPHGNKKRSMLSLYRNYRIEKRKRDKSSKIGERIAGAVRTFFSKDENLLLVEQLKVAGLKFEIEEKLGVEKSDILNGQSIVISGVFTHHSRDEYKEIIEKNGGKNVGSISKKTSFILAGDNMGPAKLEKANKLGVLIMNEEDFLKLIE